MNIPSLFFGLLFIAVGILFFFGKVHTRLAAWQEMPQEEKDKININALCRNVGEVVVLSGVIFLLNGLSAEFQMHLFTVAMIAWLVIAGLDVWYISRSRRFRKN